MSTEGDAVEVQGGPASVSRANGEAPDGTEEIASEPDGPEQGAGPAPDGPVLAEAEDAPDPALDESIAPEPGKADLEDGPAFFDEIELAGQQDGPELDPLLAPPEMSQMLFVEVALMLPATHPVVVLQQADAPFRELRIPVGGAEGIAIAYAARGIETPRPLTHELFTQVLEAYSIILDVVQITDVNGSSFSAEIVLSGPLGSRTIDCRPSDAIALSLRQRLPVPIMASPIVLAIAGTDPLGAN